jgi:hypothetical protein
LRFSYSSVPERTVIVHRFRVGFEESLVVFVMVRMGACLRALSAPSTPNALGCFDFHRALFLSMNECSRSRTVRSHVFGTSFTLGCHCDKVVFIATGVELCGAPGKVRRALSDLAGRTTTTNILLQLHSTMLYYLLFIFIVLHSPIRHQMRGSFALQAGAAML